MTLPDQERHSTIRAILARGHQRFVLFAVVLAAFCSTAAGLVLLRSVEGQNMRLAARAVVFATEPAVVFGDVGGVNDAIASVSTISSVESVRVVDEEGVELAQWRRGGGQSSAFADFANSLIGNAPHSEAIVRDGQRIGMVTVSGNPDALLRYSAVGLLVALSCIGITLLATRLLVRTLDETIVRPIENVALVADAIRIERDFSRRVAPSEIVEVDRLGRGFNALLGELESWHSRITDENERLSHRSEHDALTGLGNRLRFDRILEETIRLSGEGSSTLSLLFIDLDRFKDINDRFGHHAGDIVLYEFAERLKSSVRAKDRIFRLGGDEFAILLDRAHERLLPNHVAARIEAAMLPPVMLDSGRRISISASIGMANHPEDGATPEELYRHADADMYQQKRKETDDAK